MKGHHITYSEAELAWIKAHAQGLRRVVHAQFQEAFGRYDVNLSNYASICKRMGWLTGRTGRYEKGAVPLNKGQKMPFHPNSARTRFQKGQSPRNTKWLGHERVSKDGYVEISIAETNPHTGYERRYVLKHLHLWKQANGPLPKGHCLKCLDGNKQNTDPSNWEAVPRALLPKLAGRWGHSYDAAPAELKPTLLAVAKLQHKVREIRKR
jgi:hypothetical protein